jgi:hypothetical protein
MKRKGSNPEREFRTAQHRSEEWEADPVGRTYDGQAGDEPFEDEEEEELEDEEEEDDLDEDDEFEEEEEDEEEDDY